MRLRPTQFVFVLLLLCSVQLGEDYARQLTVVTPAYAALTAQASARRQTAATQSHPAAVPGGTELAAEAISVVLRPELLAMTPPAHSAAAIAHHTSLLRA